MGSHFSDLLQESIKEELTLLLQCFKSKYHGETPTKQLLLKMCANVFFKYLCSRRFDFDDQSFHEIVRAYDYVFYDINQSYLMDFIPWMSFLNRGYLSSLSHSSKLIRKFIESEIVIRRQSSDSTGKMEDIVDVFLNQLSNRSHSYFDYDIALFELEDLIGGSSGVANLCMRALGHIAQSEEVQNQIWKEADDILVTREEKFILLEDRQRMPFTEATVLETLRVTSSPIIPHVATVDTMVAGYFVEKGTMTIFNNYHLNFGDELWNEPKKFRPQRFLNDEGGLCKPDHFLPFSTGRRSCLGYKMVQSITFLLLANLTSQFFLHMKEEDLKQFRNVRFGSLALPLDTFSVTFTQR